MKHSRWEVAAVVEGEMNYQDARWNEGTTSTAGQHSTGEFIGFMLDYLLEANKMISRNAEPQASAMALENIRKITAMGFQCMMQNGAPERKT